MTTNELQRLRNQLCGHGNVCRTCGCKVRGVNHEQGAHHNRKVKAKSVAAIAKAEGKDDA